MSKYEFEELSIPKWKISANAVANKVYRVYQQNGEFSEIEASSANEAIKKSGMEDAYMIKSGRADYRNVFDKDMLIADEVAQAAMENSEEESDEVPEVVAEAVPAENVEAAADNTPETSPEASA